MADREMEEVYIDTIAYLEDGKGASILATFADEELYSLCAPVIEQWIKDKDPNYFLTESCDRGITMEVK
tara:strand:- start:24 stop:230 length:207 start_codon:yes stop_codon:yes gene_type:complete